MAFVERFTLRKFEPRHVSILQTYLQSFNPYLRNDQLIQSIKVDQHVGMFDKSRNYRMCGLLVLRSIVDSNTITHLSVEPGMEGQKIGTNLLSYAFVYSPYPKTTLLAFVNQHKYPYHKTFYERYGFVPTGDIPCVFEADQTFLRLEFMPTKLQ